MSRGRRKSLWGKYKDLPWELIDTESKDNPINRLLAEYRMAYGAGWVFEVRDA